MKFYIAAGIAIGLFVIFCNLADGKVFLERKEALQYLKREKRSNSQLMKELYQGSLQQECIKEVCDQEEVREVFENDIQTAAYWRLLTDRCNTSHNHCNETGTLRCESQYNSYRCVCKNGYVGSKCETDVNECEFGYCPSGFECEDLVNSFRCICPPSGCGPFQEEKQTTIHQNVTEF